MKALLSVVIITYNEAANINRCLNSVLKVADDIVVIDSFSTDETVAICRKKNVRVLQHPFENYAQQKNYAISQAKYPHILSLDADECLSPPLIASILKVKQNWQADGYRINRLNNFCGQWIRHGDWYPDRQLRLWDSCKGNWEGAGIHEQVTLAKNAKIALLKGDLLHYTFTSITQHVQQINRFTTIAAQTWYQQGKSVNAYHLYAKPCLKFLLSYLFKLGFLDGFYGWVISKNSAHATFLKYAKLKALYDDNGERRTANEGREE